MPAFLCLGAVVSVLLGQDASWDLANYHLYNGYAALRGRDAIDCAVSGLQSWINPVLDIPYAWLALGPLSQRPRLLAAIMGLWYGALLSIVFAYAVTIYRDWSRQERALATGAATLLAATGAALFSQIGTTYDDIEPATLVLAAGLVLARESDRENAIGPRAFAVMAGGLLLGLAAGLKFTSVIYGPAALIAFCSAVVARHWIASFFCIAAGAVLGFAAAGGWWCWTLWQRFGDPLFPFFNGIFHSPWYPPRNFMDQRFLPHDLWQWLFYPFFWLNDHAMLVAEVEFRDGRVAAAFLFLLIFGGMAAWRLLRRHAPVSAAATSPSPPQKFLLVFLAASYLLWLCTTSILRYAIPVEVSASLALPLLLHLVVRKSTPKFRGAMLASLTLILVATIRVPDWTRMPYRAPVVTADLHWLPTNALVILAGATLSYIVPFAPPSAHAVFIGLTDVVYQSRGYNLAEEVLRRIREHRGPIFVVSSWGGPWRQRAARDMGIVEIPGSCRSFFGSYEASSGGHLEACAGRISNVTLRSPFWKIAAARYQTVEILQPVPHWSYAAFSDAAGPAAHGIYFIDEFEYIWARPPDRPELAAPLRPHTLYILAPALKQKALALMDRRHDLLAEIDGIPVLAPGWKSCHDCGIATCGIGTVGR